MFWGFHIIMKKVFNIHLSSKHTAHLAVEMYKMTMFNFI